MYSIHMDAELDRRIKAEVQQIAMEHYDWTVEDFIRIFGKNYLQKGELIWQEKKKGTGICFTF